METNGERPNVEEQNPSAPDAWHDLLTQMSELQAYTLHLVNAKVDGMQHAVHQITTWAAIGLVGLIITAGILVTAVVLFLKGVAQGLAIAFGDRIWLGNAVTGLGLLILTAVIFFIGIRWQQRKSYNQRRQAYAERQFQQQVAFGRNVADHATDAAL